MTPRLPIRRHVRHRPALPVLCAGFVLLAGHALAQDHRPARPDPVATPGADPDSAKRPRAIEGRTLADIPIWKRITIGTHKGVNAYRAALEAAHMRIGESADEILGRPTFPFSKTRTELDLVVLTAKELGFAEGRTALADLYRRATQLGLELCPAEVGPQLRLDYVNQPIGEFLHIAMQPVATYHGDPIDLTVGNGGAGLLLVGGDARPDLTLHSSVKFVFVRPFRIALPNLE